jgi:para-aminobenzoate synthetase component 2
MVLVVDNYDSFTYNLVQYLGELGQDLMVFRNDKITIEEIERLSPDGVVISPGPGLPSQAGISKELVEHFASRLSILGVCLGHQCIAEVFGAQIVRANKLMHGKTSLIYHDGKKIYTIEGVQFHPESILTEIGKRLLDNFVII